MNFATDDDAQSGARLLIVEDDYFTCTMISDVLRKAGHHVIGVESTGEGAFSTATETRPDLVLMDVRLAGQINGFSAARFLREHGIAVLYATAHGDDASRADGEVAEPRGWLIKPFNEEELVSAVEAALHPS